MTLKLKKIIVFISLLAGLNTTQATTIYRSINMCSASVKNIPDNIQSSISKLKVGSIESNSSNIAFLIASAITAKYDKQIDLDRITAYLQAQRNQKNFYYSLLDIKKTFENLNISVEAKKNASPFDLLNLSNEILVGIDQQDQFFALVGSSQEYVYLIYGVMNRKALICPLKKSLFIQNFTTNKFLILK
ncbi:hypothetical protein POD11_00370 [Acinetobacter sp. P1(2023)]|nr:hypothetical protein [Acinetobacter sp. P1(2023)]MDC0840713.1 hypothetical protein [Acinetobacter sp. P1(2023)]